MTEGQRVRLEGLIDEYGRISNEMCCGFYGRKEEGKALKDITDFMTEIQDDLDRLFHGLARQMRDRELDPHIVNRLNTIAIQHIHDSYERRK